jgi:putative aldouronate transport system substrate-binding protein
MKNRGIALLAALLLLILAATSFAGGAKESVEIKETGKEVKLVGFLLGAAPTGMPAVMDQLNQKLKKDINATMEINYIGWGDFQAKYPLVLAAGEDIDWIFTANWSFYFQEAAKGAFYELTEDMLKKNMPRHYKTLPKQAWDQCRLPNGKLYMIPTPTPDRKVPVAVIRGDLRKKYGIPPINKFSEIEPYLKAIKDNEPEMIPMYMDSQYDVGQPYSYISYEKGPYFEDILFATGSGSGLVWYLGDETKKLHYLAEDPVLSWGKRAARVMKSWYDKGYVNKDVFANKVRSKDSFAQGKSAVGFGNSIDIQGTIAAAVANGWDVELVPGLDGNNHYRADPFLNNGVALAANTKNPERTLQALDLMIEEQSYNFLVYFGVEGVNYVLKGGKIDLPTGVTADKNTYPPDAAGFWFTNKDQFPPMANWTPAYVQHRNNIKEKGYLVTTPFVSFAAQIDEIKTEVANCNQTMVQYLQPLQVGIVKDVDDAFDLLDSKLKAAGVERIRQVLQAQVDEYMKRF